MTDPANTSSAESRLAPHPGSQDMPQWNVAELIDAPKFGWRNWAMMLGPGLVLGGAAIGGGEWLMGPMITARFGGGLFWLATLSVIAQVIYNLEISRYTLYTGEPIFTGKFRCLPGPKFWIVAYLILDFGAVFPYLAANAASPLATMILGTVPDSRHGVATLQLFGSEFTLAHKMLLRGLGMAIFLSALLPLIFGGKVLNALKALMSFKIFSVMGFLIVIGIFYTTLDSWGEVLSGFVKFGNVPIRRGEDANRNGILDPGEDWDGDGHLDIKEPSLKYVFDTDGDGKPDATDINEDGKPDPMVTVTLGSEKIRWPDLDQDGLPDQSIFLINDSGEKIGPFPLDADGDGRLDSFIDVDGDKTRDGDNLENIFVCIAQGRPLPKVDWSMLALLSALVAISGSGGLSNTPISNYTRDQGWGMGHHVGAIPSVVGGHDISLSHVGTVFIVTEESLPRWKRWYRHILRDQLIVWMPACFFGLALPSLLSVQFLKRGTDVQDQWVSASLTAGAVRDHVGGSLGGVFWYLTLFCGFLVLAPSMAASADGVIRRWVDAFWTASGRLRKLDPSAIRYVYFGVLSVYALLGIILLSLEEPVMLLRIATTIFNFALGLSCWHTLWLNLVLLPKPLRPNWFIRISMFLAGLFFLIVATIAAMEKLGLI